MIPIITAQIHTLLSIGGLLFAVAIAFGRQISVFGKIPLGLWFFRHFEQKRLVFTITSITLVSAGYLLNPAAANTMPIIGALILCGFSYFFDMRNFFPELLTTKHLPLTAAQLADDALIIGTIAPGTPVAYPLEEIVLPRHIINDTVNGRPLLVTYCALCRSGLLFDPVVNGEALTFAVSGVWRRNMIMLDTKTYSLWQQGTGECIYGPYKGTTLSLYGSEQITWKSWKEAHPDTVLGVEPPDIPQAPFQYSLLHRLIHFTTNLVTVPGRSRRLHERNPREIVYGIQINDSSKAYPRSELEKRSQTTFTDSIGSTEITLEYDKENTILRAWQNDPPNQLIVEQHWWLGWVEFHQDTEIYRSQTQ